MESDSCVLTRIQREVGEWAQKNFGDNPSHHPDYEGVKLFSIPPFYGMVEELGEMAGPQAKLHQGRYLKTSSDQERMSEYKMALEDGLADWMIFACDFARREGIDLAQVLARTWETVKQRMKESWEADKAQEDFKPNVKGYTENVHTDIHKSHKRVDQSAVDTVPDEQTGQGWAEPSYPEGDVRNDPDDPNYRSDGNNYDRTCEICNYHKVHNLARYPICPSCRGKTENQAQIERIKNAQSR